MTVIIVVVIVITIIMKMTMAIAIRRAIMAIIIIIIIIIIIVIISIFKASISLTVLGALQYHKKCYSIKTTSVRKKIRYNSRNQGKVW